MSWNKGKEYRYKLGDEMTPELAYVAGVCLGDGWLSKGKKYNNRIGFTCSDKKFARKFIHAIKTMGLKPHVLVRKPTNHPSSVVRTPAEKQKLRYCIDVYALCLYRILENLYKDFNKLVAELFNAGVEWNFIAGFYDSEGWTNPKYQQVVMYNTDIKRLSLIRKILVKVGLHPPPIKLNNKRKNKKHKDLFRIALYRNEEASLFLRKVR